jgi:hypothetical protein
MRNCASTFASKTTQVQLVTSSGFACRLTPSSFEKRFIEHCSITSLRWRARYPICVKNRQAAGAFDPKRPSGNARPGIAWHEITLESTDEPITKGIESGWLDLFTRL